MFKRLFLLAAALMSFHTVQAADSANIRIKMSGAIHDNTYFLCIPNVGCLSIRHGQEGKTYPVMQQIEMDRMFVVNQDTRQLSPQGLPDSCKVTVKPQQTITISGQLTVGRADVVHVNQLRCSVS
jgi:hypothetical protein